MKANLEKLAKDNNLHLDPEFLKSLALVLNYGFQDQLEVQMTLENFIVSANLNRLNLREREDLVIRKYSRKTEVDFILFGIITQYPSKKPDLFVDQNKNTEPANIKKALMNLISSISSIEGTFTGRLNNEIIIDPIALYTEV
ncbi:hypothetical protein SAMN05216326_15217 [Nitrosomonas marina]|uniref:Uncharacterized protein n=1 Tax=Nitrosomonas marina TaxID=917 RepID=A0A1I0G5R8_9PROT|nr:hypothetical protein [Nitrosomonas marina]SET65279.1 hypothetical protein SAMN05216326_15217 [Nitrosomonas marina]